MSWSRLSRILLEQILVWYRDALGTVQHQHHYKSSFGANNYDEIKWKVYLKKDWRVFRESTMLSARSFSFACDQWEYGGDCENVNQWWLNGLDWIVYILVQEGTAHKVLITRPRWKGRDGTGRDGIQVGWVMEHLMVLTIIKIQWKTFGATS